MNVKQFALIKKDIRSITSNKQVLMVRASSVMAASSFVGEKEKHTLETLLYSPLSLKQLFQSKILAGFLVGMMVSYISFAAMMLLSP